MKIGLLSDTHDNARNTRAALDTFRARGIRTLIHCGDLTTPEIVRLFVGWDVYFVFGNMDRAQSTLIDTAKAVGVRPPKQTQIVELDGASIAVTHGDRAAEMFRLQVSGKYAYLCHGHTHERRNEYHSGYGIRIINPGALGGNKPEERSIAILDLESGDVEFITFPAL